MDWIWSPLSGLQEALREAVGGSSSDLSAGHVPVPLPEKIDDHVYEICKPIGRPSVEIVFFHGLQLEDYKEAYMTTWLSRDKSECWLRWLLADFPEARILTVSYDASASRTDDTRRMDMYVTGENLVHSLTRTAEVGQDGCPVLLVGHCLGGLVMKELCYQALLMHALDWSDEPVDNFLINVKGLFFYGTPHNGSILADSTAELLKGPLLGDLTTLNAKTARSNEIFRKLRKRYKWKTYGVAELFPVKLKNFRGIVVPEASSRHDMDSYYSAGADHYNICKPRDRTASTFQVLVDFIRSLFKEAQERSPGFEADSGSLSNAVGLEARSKEVEEKLQGAQCFRLGIVGMGGIGKTTLARAVFANISNTFEYTCFFEEVKKATVKHEDLGDLQAKILDRLYHKGKRVAHKSLLFDWSKLKGKKVLLVLDDVESVNQFHVMTDSDGFGEESCLIVTSRNKSCVEKQKFELYEVERLGLQDSITLFCHHAFKDGEMPGAYQKRVARLVNKCGGLPLTLKVVGAYLCNQQEVGVWDDALKKLSRAQSLDGEEDDELWAKLRVSYDSLALAEKEMFLDVATCFHGYELDDVKAIWRACDWGSPESGWQNLLDRCLVSAIHPTDRNGLRVQEDWREIHSTDWNELQAQKDWVESGRTVVWMHEQLRDLGQSIACPDNQIVAKHTRVNGIHAANQLGIRNKEYVTKVKVLTIIEGQETAMDLKFLRKLTELKILCLHGVYSCQSSFPSQLSVLSMSHSNEHFFYKSLTQISRIHSLRVLSLRSPTLRSFPDSFIRLSQLEHLELQCPSVEKLPQRFGNLSSLQRLELKNCTKLETLPESLGQLHCLQHLTIADCGISELLVGQLHALEHLTVKNCHSLRVSTIDFWQLQDLRHLDIQNCKAIAGCYYLSAPYESDWTHWRLQNGKPCNTCSWMTSG